MSTLPFKTLPKSFFIHLIYYAIIFLNCIPESQYIYENFSLREIIIGRALDFNKHYKAQLGSYVEANEDRAFNNNQNPRTFTGIYLGRTGNIQGTLKVFYPKNSVVKKPRTMT